MKIIRQYLISALVSAGMMFGFAAALAQDNQEVDNEEMTIAAEVPAEDLGVAILSAVVDSDGTFVRGSGVLSAANLNSGSYEVIFRRNVRACTYVATIGIPGSTGAAFPGEINVAGRATDPNGVFVDTQDSAGNDENHPFHLIVFCNR